MKKRDKPVAKSSTPAKRSREPADSQLQGEGDYAADRRYRERTDHFLKSADVDEVAHAAAPKSKAEAQELAAAEQEGRAHAHLPEKRGTKSGDKTRR